MSDPLQTTTVLLDIEPPVHPAESDLGIYLTALTLLIILAIFIVFAIRQYISPRSKAKRCLQQLQKIIKNSNREMASNYGDAEDAKEISYQLAHILAIGVGLNGVTISTTLPDELNHQQERWQHFTRELSAARYEQKLSHPSSLDRLFKETLFFLKNWP